MDATATVESLSALAHHGRLAVFRLLVKAGPGGMAAGEIARRLRTAANTMSAQLLVLSHARLVQARREGRSIIYAVNFDVMTDLLVYLTQDCCQGSAEVCAPLSKVLQGCCEPGKGKRHETPARSRCR